MNADLQVSSNLSWNDLRTILDGYFSDPERSVKDALQHLQELLGREPRPIETLLVKRLHRDTAPAETEVS